MRIKNFSEFSINEDAEPFNDSPETYIDIALTKLKKKIDGMFEAEAEGEESEGDDEKPVVTEKTPEQAREDKKKSDETSFTELGLKLESSEISKYSKLYDSLTVKFSDEKYLYHLYVMMKLEDAISKEPGTEIEQSGVDEAYIVFKKYDIQSLEIVGQLSKNIKTSEITQDYIVDLKLEVDEAFGDADEEEFKIETE
jgi:hypothetical protein